MQAHELLVLNEVVDSKFDQVFWEDITSMGLYDGYAKFANEPDYFHVQIRVMQLVVAQKRITFAEIDFERSHNGSYTIDLLDINANTSKIFGGLLHVLVDKIREINKTQSIDALIFSVVASETKRLKLYELLLKRPFSTMPYRNVQYYLDLGNNMTAMIASKKSLSTQEHNSLKSFLEKHEKKLI
jgi:hypothetical protein